MRKPSLGDPGGRKSQPLRWNSIDFGAATGKLSTLLLLIVLIGRGRVLKDLREKDRESGGGVGRAGGW